VAVWLIFAIYFEHEELDNLFDALIKKDIEFIALSADKSYFWREAVLCDLSGNKINFFWRLRIG
jgi:hypothetical protein